MARGTIRAFQVVGSIAIFFAAVAHFPRALLANGPSLGQFVPIALGVIAIVAVGRFSDRLRHWLDRRFFREAYNAEQLLSDLAMQVRTIVETQPLLETVTRQIAEREKRRRELEIAREVQQRLFPQTYPFVDGLELAGHCRPALEAGGDY